MVLIFLYEAIDNLSLTIKGYVMQPNYNIFQKKKHFCNGKAFVPYQIFHQFMGSTYDQLIITKFPLNYCSIYVWYAYIVYNIKV